MDVEELVRVVEAALVEAATDKARFGAVNWGDLGVVEVERRESLLWPDQSPWHAVIIEEGDCSKLRAFVQERLKGFPDTFVELEW